MGDLSHPRWMYLKAGLFLVIILLCAGLIWLESPRWETILLVLLMIWAAARLYYFMFYVIENYIDEDYRFSGVVDFLKYLLSRKQPPKS